MNSVNDAYLFDTENIRHGITKTQYLGVYDIWMEIPFTKRILSVPDVIKFAGEENIMNKVKEIFCNYIKNYWLFIGGSSEDTLGIQDIVSSTEVSCSDKKVFLKSNLPQVEKDPHSSVGILMNYMKNQLRKMGVMLVMFE